MLYAGTPALKGDFTRTGQRTKMGLLQDGTNSAIRYVVNNFQDHRYVCLSRHALVVSTMYTAFVSAPFVPCVVCCG